MKALAARQKQGDGWSVEVVIYGVPDWSPYATFAKMNPLLTLISSALGYMGGYIEAVGKPGGVGGPTTVVHAANLSQAAILDGRGCISFANEIGRALHGEPAQAAGASRAVA